MELTSTIKRKERYTFEGDEIRMLGQLLDALVSNEPQEDFLIEYFVLGELYARYYQQLNIPQQRQRMTLNGAEIIALKRLLQRISPPDDYTEILRATIFSKLEVQFPWI